MRRHSKLLLVAVTTALVLAVGIGTASARRIETSSQAFRAVWTPLEFTGGVFAVRCSVTLEGSFHSKTLSKVEGQLVGYITRAALTSPCSSGSATVLTAHLPWHIQYKSFTGTLPNITNITTKLIGAEFQVSQLGVTCLYITEAAEPAIGIINVSAGTVTGLRADETAKINRINCPEGGFKGTAAVTVPGTTTPITVQLVQ